jgi:peptidoglycan hydrolase-like protein with peptidoglycan-binding domain
VTTRAAVVARAASANGYLDGMGYDGPNRYSAELRLPVEAWCGDFVTGTYLEAGLPLPVMQPGHRQGFSYCPDAVRYAREHGAARSSWQAEPGDLALFDWNGDGVADHVELVESYAGGILHTIGGNSGGSNVDAYRGKGGVHRHIWTAPANVGNPQVLTVANAGTLVAFGSPNVPTPPPGPPFPGRLLVLKSPPLSGTDVRTWQQRMSDRGWPLAVDARYGPVSRDTCLAFQREKHLAADGIVGPATWVTAWTAPITS